MLKNTNDRIWLVIGDQRDFSVRADFEVDFRLMDPSDICWSETKEFELDVEYVRADLYEALRAENEALKHAMAKQGKAALMGMDAAKQIGATALQRAERLNAESSPDALESERKANALLTAEVAQLTRVNATTSEILERTQSELANLRSKRGIKASDLFEVAKGAEEAMQEAGETIASLNAEVEALRNESAVQIGWCRYIVRHEKEPLLRLCDSDTDGAFPVFKSRSIKAEVRP